MCRVVSHWIIPLSNIHGSAPHDHQNGENNTYSDIPKGNVAGNAQSTLRLDVTKIVIASEAWRSRDHGHSPTIPGSPRRFAPRNDVSVRRQHASIAQNVWPAERVFCEFATFRATFLAPVVRRLARSRRHTARDRRNSGRADRARNRARTGARPPRLKAGASSPRPEAR